MPLNITIDVNGEVIHTITLARTQPLDPTGVQQLYPYEMIVDGDVWEDTMYHNRQEGALMMAADALGEIVY